MNILGLDLAEAAKLLDSERYGDWYRDPWGWPELRPEFVETLTEADLPIEKNGTKYRFAHSPKLHAFEVPKSFFGQRPAVMLDAISRLAYAAAVVPFAKSLEAGTPAWVFGWRFRNGTLARGTDEWQAYRASHSTMRHSLHAGETDITSFFASVDHERLLMKLKARKMSGLSLDVVETVIRSHASLHYRSGIPQRSSASALLAQIVLSDVDEVIQSQINDGRIAAARRWMDDISFEGSFEDVYGLILEIQKELRTVGLEINASKTKVHLSSARADALEDQWRDLIEVTEETYESDEYPGLSYTYISQEDLSNAEHRSLQRPSETERTTLGLVLRSLRSYEDFDRVEDWMDVARMVPHGADHLSRYLRDAVSHKRLSVSRINAWFEQEHASDWPHTEWVAAQHAIAIADGIADNRTQRILGDWVRTTDNAQKLAVATQRMANFDPIGLRRSVLKRVDSCADPMLLRIFVLALLSVGYDSTNLDAILSRDPHNALLLKFLRDRNWKGLTPVGDFAGAER